MSEGAGSAQLEGQAKQRSRDAGVLVMGRLAATLSDALLPLVIVRLLGKGDVGVLTSVLLVYTTVALVLSTGFPTALMYHMPGRPLAERRAIAVQQARSLLYFGVAAAAVIAATSVLPALLPVTPGSERAALVHGGFGHLFLLAAFPLGDLPARMLPNLLVIEGRADAVARFTVAKSIGNALFVILPASLGLGISAVLLSYSVFGLLQGAVLVYFLRSLYAHAERTRPPVSFRDMARFALPLGMTDIVSMLGGRLDRFIISIAFPVTVFAEYQAGAFQIPILTAVAYNVGTAYTPLLTELIRAGKAREALATWRGSVQKVALIVVPLSAVFAIAAEEVVELLFTRDYLRAASVFRCYALLTMGRVAAFGIVIVAAGRPQLVFRSALFTLFANVVFGVLCLYAFGFVGPAVGALLAFVPVVAVYCRYIALATGLRFSEIFPLLDYLKVLALCAIASLPAIGLKQALGLPAAVTIGVVAVTTLGLFTLLGVLAGLITREDFRYLGSVLRAGRRSEPSASS